ncbi:hypothetical protein [Mycobacterium sp. 155]|uniref:hypothetical protein n=1 Tax=Mycobacterium sp. 155 TaxID=1157943 RepID=UPI0003A95BEA|nr:hypothetical protein [Mycobacterium sp. 155]
MPVRSSAVKGLAIAGVGAAAIATTAPAVVTATLPTLTRDVQLAASPAPGAILGTVLSNQLGNFQLQWPYVREGVVDAPTAVLVAPLTFLGAVQSGASPLVIIGVTGGSITQPVSDAWDGIITTDLDQILPRAQNSLLSTIVAGFNVGESVTGGLPAYLEALVTGRNQVFNAVSQPLSDYPDQQPPLPDTLPEVVAVESVNVLSGVVFGGGELVALGILQAPNDFYQTLAEGGSLGDAVGASAARVEQRVGQGVDVATASIENAVVNIRNAKHGIFPTADDVEAEVSSSDSESNTPTTNNASAKNMGTNSVASVPTGVLTPPKLAITPPSAPRSGSTTVVRPSFKAVVGSIGTPPRGGNTAPEKAMKSPVGQLSSTVSGVGAQVKKVTDGLAKAVTPRDKAKTSAD